MKALKARLNRALAKLPHIEDDLPETFAGLPVTYLGDGIHRVTYQLGDKWVLKFPCADWAEDQASANSVNITEYMLSKLFRKAGLLDYFAETYAVLTGFSLGPVLLSEYIPEEIDDSLVADWEYLEIEDSYLNRLADILEPIDVALFDIHTGNIRGKKVVDYGSFDMPKKLYQSARKLLSKWAA